MQTNNDINNQDGNEDVKYDEKNNANVNEAVDFDEENKQIESPNKTSIIADDYSQTTMQTNIDTNDKDVTPPLTDSQNTQQIQTATPASANIEVGSAETSDNRNSPLKSVQQLISHTNDNNKSDFGKEFESPLLIETPRPVRFQQHVDNFHKFPLPSQIGDLDYNAIVNRIENQNELYFVSLKKLCDEYYECKKIMHLASMTHNIQSGANINEVTSELSFFVCIGTRKAFNSILSLPFNSSKRDKKNSLYLEGSPDYEKLFIPFYSELFLNSETDSLEKTFTSEDILTIAIFGRINDKPNKNGRIFIHDYLFASASIVIDNEASCLLSWLGVRREPPPSFPIPKGLTKTKFKFIQNFFGLGSFLICTCQIIKSIRLNKWVPILCQVYDNIQKGPIHFYKKNYFLKINKQHDIIYRQYLKRRKHIIVDEQLKWIVLFQPFMYLTNFAFENKKEDEIIKIILDRAEFFFLKQRRYLFSQEDIAKRVSKNLNVSHEEIERFSINTIIEDKIVESADDTNNWIEFSDMNDNPVYPSINVLKHILSVDKQNIVNVLNYNVNNSRLHESNVNFMVMAKIFHGNPIYYETIRQFFYYLYRGISCLHTNHMFFKNIMPNLITLIIQRCYTRDKQKVYGASTLISQLGLYKDVSIMKDNKGNIMKRYYKPLLQLYAESFLRSRFHGDESDLCILKYFFNAKINLLQIATSDRSPVNNHYKRNFQISINSSDENYCNYEYIKEFLFHLLLIGNFGSDSVESKIWLAKLSPNRIFVLSDKKLSNPRHLKFPNEIGGQIFNPTIIKLTFEESPNKMDYQNLTEQNFDLIIEQIEDDGNKLIEEMVNKYLKQRDWKRFSKLLPIEGGKLHPNDEMKYAIGPMFDFDDIKKAGLNEEMILPLMRILDPWKQLYDLNISPIDNLASFRDLMTLRKKTWLRDFATIGFINWLNSNDESQFTDDYFILDPSSFNKIMECPAFVLNTFKRRTQLKKIMILLYTVDHYIVVEIDLLNKNQEIQQWSQIKKIKVVLADSLGCDLKYLQNIAIQCHIDLFIESLFPNATIIFTKASNMPLQENGYDCGVICLQRLYALKRYNQTSLQNTSQDYLTDTVSFRLFIISSVLSYYRKRLSHLVYADLKHYRQTEESDLEIDARQTDKSNLEIEDKNISITDVLNNSSTYGDINQNPSITTNENESDDDDNQSTVILPRSPKSIRTAPSKILRILNDDDDSGTIASHAGKYTPTKSISKKAIIIENYNKKLEEDELTVETSDNEFIDDIDNNNFPEASPNPKAIPIHNVDKTPKAVPIPSNNKKSSKLKTKKKRFENKSEARISRKYKNRRNNLTSKLDNKKTKEQKSVNSTKKRKTISSTPPLEEPNNASQQTTAEQSDSDLDIPIKNLPLKKRAKMQKQKNTVRKKNSVTENKLEKLELRKANRLSTIQKDIERYDKWNPVPEKRKEIDIFAPDSFVKKKIGSNVTDDIINDVERLKTKLYHPDQYDKDRAKEAFEAEINDDYEKKVADLKEATDQFNTLANVEKDRKRKSKELQKWEKQIQELSSEVKLLDWQKQWVPVLLPFDSIYALRTSINRYSKKVEYYAVVKNPDGSYKEKLVSRDWLDINIDKEFLDKFDRTEKETGWVMFANEDENMKIIKDATDVRNVLSSNNCAPIYTYRPQSEDDEIHCLRVCVEFAFPYHKLKRESVRYAVMTSKDSLSQHPKIGPNNNPWEYRNQHNIKCHIYTEISGNMLKETIGQFFYECIDVTISDAYRAEYKNIGNPYQEPCFDFTGSNVIAKYLNKSRFIDPYDLSKPDSLSKNAVFMKEHCGVLAHRQYYYYDFSKLTTKYYINVSTTQIRSLRWRPEFRQFWGLERTYVNGVEKFKHVVLDNQWVETNFQKEVLETVRKVGESNKVRYVRLPVGSSNMLQSLEQFRHYPETVYRQNNENTCVFVSIANALHYLQFEDVALQVDNEKRRIMKEGFRDNFERLMMHVSNYLNTQSHQYFRSKYCVNRLIETNKFNLIESGKKKPNIIYHVVLRSKDGSETHAVAVVHSLIFDGNFANAMPLSQQNLDIICNSRFIGVVEGYKYICIK